MGPQRATTASVTGGIRRIELPVAGLTCANCVQAVERALRAVPGVAAATVNLAGGRAFVDYDAGATAISALHEAIKATGYRVGTAAARLGIRGTSRATSPQRLRFSRSSDSSSVTVIANATRLRRWKPRAA